jgi:hypothetical protein
VSRTNGQDTIGRATVPEFPPHSLTGVKIICGILNAFEGTCIFPREKALRDRNELGRPAQRSNLFQIYIHESILGNFFVTFVNYDDPYV